MKRRSERLFTIPPFRQPSLFELRLTYASEAAEGIVPMREHVVAENISRYLVLPPNGLSTA